MARTPYDDKSWDETVWKRMLVIMIKEGLVSWKDITTLTLGHINPPQVGTSLASSKGFKQRYGKGKVMKVVLEWFYAQKGNCADCGARLELQADHNKPRESFKNRLDADFIENMLLRCRRCNVIKRPSHKLGGATHLTAEAALMWLLFTFKPRTLKDFVSLCRLYGMTMADVRMREGWAMAEWLEDDHHRPYVIDRGRQPSTILRWPDGSVTRIWVGDRVLKGSTKLVGSAPAGRDLVFIAAVTSVHGQHRLSAFRIAVQEIPFSHYIADQPQALAVHYSAPNRRKGTGPTLTPLPPRGMDLLAVRLVRPTADVSVSLPSKTGKRRLISLGKSRKRALGLIADARLKEVTIKLRP